MRRGLILAASLLALILPVARLEARSKSQREGRIIFIVGESGDLGRKPKPVRWS